MQYWTTDAFMGGDLLQQKESGADFLMKKSPSMNCHDSPYRYGKGGSAFQTYQKGSWTLHMLRGRDGHGNKFWKRNPSH